MALDAFHPAVAEWFADTLGRPTEVQRRAWPEIGLRRHTLLSAPTGSGKTLAAFLAAIDDLVREGLARGLRDETRVLYVSPLKALSNDVQKNLQQPLAGIRDRLFLRCNPQDAQVRAMVRTGDTPPGERQKMARRPPHILVTTPESVYVLLTSESGRRMLSTVRTVIVDEIHALAGNKRGAHLALSLERLEALTPHRLARVGLSATQKPIERMARFLLGDRDEHCSIIDTNPAGAVTHDLALELPRSPLATIMSNEVWEEVYDRLAELVAGHRTTLIFVNTRRLCERATRHLAERLGERKVTAHHGSLARRHRLRAEQRLKAGRLRALVATASLELGIDIGDVDLVCQLGSPRAIATFMQRVGRAGHGVGAVSIGRLFPLSQDDLVECTALLGCARRGELDRIPIPEQPLDVLAQQIVAEVAASDEWRTDRLYQTLRRAWPYRNLGRSQFDAVVRMLAQGFSTRRGRRGAHVHHDAVNGRLRPRRGARLTAMTNGGAIPDQFEYEVILQPEDVRIGTLGEDFAFESVPGDIFQLGNTSYRINKVESGRVYVEDAHGEPPTLPFWFGEAPGRTDELSAAVSSLREGLDARLAAGLESAVQWLRAEFAIEAAAAEQLAEFLAAGRAALGLLPTQTRLVFERFFDEAGDMHMVVHAPVGSRINRAWGLALRKRFCRKFNFELQAAALDDTLVLSLGPTHSFPLGEVASYLKRATVRQVLIQALLDAPMFEARWRWNATIALAVRRNRNGRRVPAQWQRSDAEDLVALVFPDQLACLENIAGEREVPDHPLVEQTIADCLTDTMDIDGLEALLERLADGAVTVECRDLNGPSPLAQAVLNARPYAFLDDAPAEERRTLAVQSRRFRDAAEAAELGRLDPAAIARVRVEAWPQVRTADELHDALVLLGFMGEDECRSGEDGLDLGHRHLFDALAAEGRATRLGVPGGAALWVAAERLAELRRVCPAVSPAPTIAAVAAAGPGADDADTALRELVRSRLEGLGPVTSAMLAAPLGRADVDAALLALEADGFAVRGAFTGEGGPTEWCDRRLLARIHRYTVRRLRREIEPVSPARHERFLARWHGLAGDAREGLAALEDVLGQLEGCTATAAAWEEEILPARIADYRPDMLDQLCASGRIVWMRLGARASGRQRTGPVRRTPITLMPRRHARHWRALVPVPDADAVTLSPPARAMHALLASAGALFFDDLAEGTRLEPREARAALAELVAWGLVGCDSFAGIRALTLRRARLADGRRAGREAQLADAGRWSLAASGDNGGPLEPESLEHIARTLLRRHGVVFRAALAGETWLPPWRELLRVYWRLEARGEVRGGRFVTGHSGEQFAAPEALPLLRSRGGAPAAAATPATSAPLFASPGARPDVAGGSRTRA